MESGRWTGKRKLLLLAVVAVALLLVVLEFAPPRTVSMSWSYDYAHDPPCTSRLTGNCVSGFRVFVGELNHRSQQLFVSNRFDSGHNVVSQRVEAAFEVERFGYLQLCVVAVKNGQIGVTVESTPMCMKRLVLPFGVGSSWAR
jgi:hypothetical protein